MQKFVSSRDLLASVVVFLVALPLCMGIAIASGAPPALGLITGIVGGLVVGFLAGSPLQVSGPAAGLSVLVYQLVQEHGLAILGAVVLGAGAIQLTSGILKCGQWFRAISPSVIFGMLAGIGVLIFASQFHVMVDDEPRSSGIANLISIPAALYKGIFPIDGSTHHLAAFVGLLTIGTLIGWNYFRPRPLRMVPSALVAVVVASAAAWMLELPIRRIDVPANLLDGANWLTSEIFASLLEPAIMLQAAVFALVASAETLLCAAALDQMHDGKPTDFDRELRAQGIGNMICGVFGALPMTGVIVRSSANVQAGAETRASAILHGAWLLSAIAVLPWLLNHIPTASLAAILVYTGYKLVDISKIRRIAGFGRIEIVIYVATVAGIVLTDLLTGVLIGFGLAIVKLAYTFSRLDVHATHSKDINRVDLNLRGAATFLGLPRLAAALERVPAGAELHVHIEHLDYIDHACMELLSSWEKRNERLGGKLKVEWDGLVDRCQRKKNQDPAERSDSHAATLAAMGRS